MSMPSLAGKATDSASAATSAGPLLEIERLVVEFKSPQGVPFRAVDGVALKIEPGETSASSASPARARSVAALSLMRLLPSLGASRRGKILFQGRDIVR